MRSEISTSSGSLPSRYSAAIAGKSLAGIGRAVVRAANRLSILDESVDVEARPVPLWRHSDQRYRAAGSNEVDRELDGLDQTDALEHVIGPAGLIGFAREQRPMGAGPDGQLELRRRRVDRGRPAARPVRPLR